MRRPLVQTGDVPGSLNVVRLQPADVHVVVTGVKLFELVVQDRQLGVPANYRAGH